MYGNTCGFLNKLSYSNSILVAMVRTSESRWSHATYSSDGLFFMCFLRGFSTKLGSETSQAPGFHVGNGYFA